MAGELGVERFRDVFEKLYETLKSVHENERKLTKKCRQLNDEIAVNVARVSAVLVLTQQEEMTNTEMRQVTASSSSSTPADAADGHVVMATQQKTGHS